MHKILNNGTAILLFVVMGVGGAALGNGAVADTDIASGIPKIHNGAQFFEDDGPIMWVDCANGNIVIKEMQFVVGQFSINNKVHTTRLVDAKGNKVALDYFKAGQWVIVRGYRVAESKIYVQSMRAVAGYLEKDRRIIEPMVASPY
ncbi:MAG: hypothetical protein PVH87_19330 [Desulfobacteraceae bacterium]|jgi:hypothetical protein